MAYVADAFAGARFGRLVVEKLHPVKSKHVRLADVLCDCGERKTLPVANIGAMSNSCGCLQKELKGSYCVTHGKSKSREYEIWCGMLKRCTNPKHRNYEDYGGRGISVSESWQKFENFYTDMGDSNGLELERVNNALGYSKDNCMWASRHDQARNKRNNVYVVYSDKKIVLKDASELVGVKYKALHHRLSKALWPISKALGEGFSWPDGINPYTGDIDR